MVKKIFPGIIGCTVTSFIIAMFPGNCLCAGKEETHKHFEKGLSPEHEVEIIKKPKRVLSPESEKEVHKHQEKGLAPRHEVEIREEQERVPLSKTEKEVHKHLEKGLAPKHEVERPFICPKCKVRRESTPWGRTLAEKSMVCPECENTVDGFMVHSCEVCGTDVLVCPLCRKAAAMLKTEETEEEEE